MARIVARWEAKGGRRYVQLYRDQMPPGMCGGYYYEGDGCGGGLPGHLADDEAAIAYMQNPWGPNVGIVTVLRDDFPSVKRVPLKGECR